MTIVLPVSQEAAPLPSPLLAYAARGSTGRVVALFGPAVAEADWDAMTEDMVAEMERTGRDRVWRVSEQ